MNIRVGTWAWLDKNQLAAEGLSTLRKVLTVTPRKVGNYPGDDPSPIELFHEVGNLFGVPRNYPSVISGRHVLVPEMTDGDRSSFPGSLRFNGTPKPEQAHALASVLSTLRSGSYGGLVRAPCGWGKTVFACALIQALNIPTLVVVHKEFLLNQWVERLEQFLPGIKIGIIQQDKCDFVGRHIAIGMVQSLSSREYPLEFYRWPGLVLYDECHRVGAYEWSKVPPKFPARYRIGLSATPRRKDGTDSVFLWHLGPVIYVAKVESLPCKIRRVWTGLQIMQTSRFNPALANKTILLRFLIKNPSRNLQIIEQLVKAVKAGRKILVLSERLQHLHDLDNLFKQQWPVGDAPPTTGYYVGGMSESALDKSSECQVIWATSQMTSEGLDIPEIDTMFLTTPLSDVEQAVGRIRRPHPDKKEPIVVDFIDDRVPQFERLAQTRQRYYTKMGWT